MKVRVVVISTPVVVIVAAIEAVYGFVRRYGLRGVIGIVTDDTSKKKKCVLSPVHST